MKNIPRWLFWDDYENKFDWLKALLITFITLIIVIFLMLVFSCNCSDRVDCTYMPGIDYSKPYLHTYHHAKGGTGHDITFFRYGVQVTDGEYKPNILILIRIGLIFPSHSNTNRL